MSRVTYNELLDAGVHFGHLKRKWNPKMAPYIFMERNGIHIIDLNKTAVKLDEAAAALKQIVKSGKKVLFVATKKQAKAVVAERAKNANMPFITERWPGGMLTNFATVRKSIKKMVSFEKMATDGTFDNISKKERLQITRQKAKMQKLLGSIAELSRIPAALFIVDIKKEHIALAEAQKLNIPTFAIVDTNADPTSVDFPIPANDDATKSVSLIVDTLCQAIEEGLNERKHDKEIERDREKEGSEAEEVTSENKQEHELASVVDDEEAPKVGTAGKRKRTTGIKKKEIKGA